MEYRWQGSLLSLDEGQVPMLFAFDQPCSAQEHVLIAPSFEHSTSTLQNGIKRTAPDNNQSVMACSGA
jgi:hypothetical protein